MSQYTAQQVHLKSRPAGMPTHENFALVTVELSQPAAGEVLVKNLYMSVDPYMRGRMREAWPTGEVLQGAAVGKVIASNHGDFATGDYVSHGLGWREHSIVKGAQAGKVDPNLAPLSAYLGVMGMPGLTAYGGLLVTGEYQDGETVFVSAASGAVGSVVGQAVKQGIDLAAMPLATLRGYSEHIDEDVFEVLTVEGSVAARDHVGGTAPARVRAAARDAKR